MLASAFTILPAKNTYAEKCPEGTVQAGLEIGVDGVKVKDKDGNRTTKTNNKGKVTNTTGRIESIAQCNMDGYELASTNKSLTEMLQTVVNIVLSVLGIIAVIVIIIGGFTYMTSAGDAAKLTKAKNTILYGIVGLVIALLAYAIVNFVLSTVFGS